MISVSLTGNTFQKDAFVRKNVLVKKIVFFKNPESFKYKELHISTKWAIIEIDTLIDEFHVLLIILHLFLNYFITI